MIENIFLEPARLPAFLAGYHPRPTQMKAATLIDEALSNYKNIVLEAPTGSGKTMAYLIPVFEQGKRTLISTKTKQLMQQIYLKDIPVMHSLYGHRNVAVLKGRKNYFCPHRFMRWIYPNGVFYEDVINWYNMQDMLGELPRGLFDGAILDKMSADSRQCLYSKCQYFSACPFYAAREAANQASVVITNHHLLLTDIAMKAEESFASILEPADHIIFDEAHSVPDIYAVYAGAEVSTRRLVALVSDYKDKLPFDKLQKLHTLQDRLWGLVTTEGKVHYEKIRKEIYPFMDLCRELVQIAADSDLKDEFKKWEDSFAILEGEEEGLRFAEQKGRDMLLKFVPMHIGNTFINGLHRGALSSVFISATLTTKGNFEYFLRETGLGEINITTAKLPSVFQMNRQAKLLVPKVNSGEQDNVMLELVRRIEGSVLIICNSTRRMQELIEFMADRQEEKAVFSQDDGDWSTFTSNQNIVLVGCATLREGIDLAGGDFKCVIIDKLPFEYPHDLYLAKKAQMVEQEVGNAFVNFNLPRAVLYFKQAAGRLIRHESDRGIIAVFDSRILFKSYGKYFLDVLENVTLTDSVEEAVNFLS